MARLTLRRKLALGLLRTGRLGAVAAALLASAALLLPLPAGAERAVAGEIAAQSLAPEVRAALALIAQGGPFPYRKDGASFGNREHRLPARPRGYYREYTVPTPGARDRGARRIIAGRAGEYYYTDDHYRSFQRIRP